MAQHVTPFEVKVIMAAKGEKTVIVPMQYGTKVLSVQFCGVCGRMVCHPDCHRAAVVSRRRRPRARVNPNPRRTPMQPEPTPDLDELRNRLIARNLAGLAAHACAESREVASILERGRLRKRDRLKLSRRLRQLADDTNLFAREPVFRTWPAKIMSPGQLTFGGQCVECHQTPPGHLGTCSLSAMRSGYVHVAASQAVAR